MKVVDSDYTGKKLVLEKMPSREKFDSAAKVKDTQVLSERPSPDLDKYNLRQSFTDVPSAPTLGEAAKTASQVDPKTKATWIAEGIESFAGKNYVEMIMHR